MSGPQVGPLGAGPQRKFRGHSRGCRWHSRRAWLRFRGIDGKIEAIEYARENGVPFFGICLGMQCAVIEFARNVLGLDEAHSTEIKDYTPHPVIDMMEEQKNIADMGGTMRLGAYPCALAPGSHASAAYGKARIEERHRHRYEFNDQYREQFTEAGMIPREPTPTPDWSRLSRFPTTLGSWALNSIRNTKAPWSSPPAVQGLP